MRVLRTATSAASQVALMGALFMFYKYGRHVADGHATRASANALRVLRFEQFVHLPQELGLQRGPARRRRPRPPGQRLLRHRALLVHGGVPRVVVGAAPQRMAQGSCRPHRDDGRRPRRAPAVPARTASADAGGGDDRHAAPLGTVELHESAGLGRRQPVRRHAIAPRRLGDHHRLGCGRLQPASGALGRCRPSGDHDARGGRHRQPLLDRLHRRRGDRRGGDRHHPPTTGLAHDDLAALTGGRGRCRSCRRRPASLSGR